MNLTRKHIQALIETRYIERGESYLAEGMVELLTIGAGTVTARCAGTRLYSVELRMTGNRLSGHCTCPAFGDFGPCKHMAATGLALIGSRQGPYRPSSAYLARKNEADELQRRLKRKTKSELVDVIMTLIESDPDLRWIVEDDGREEEQ